MPRYDYECPACGDVKEIVHRIGEDHIERCVSCGFLLRKKFSAPATHFKGGGWGGSYPGRTFKTTSHADAATGEIGSQTTTEIGPAIKKDARGNPVKGTAQEK